MAATNLPINITKISYLFYLKIGCLISITAISFLYITSNNLFVSLSSNSLWKGTELQKSALRGAVRNGGFHCNEDFRSPLTDHDNNFTRKIKHRITEAEKRCKSNNKHSSLLQKVLAYFSTKVVVDQTHAVLYVPIPKTGTTNWKKIFAHITIPEYQNLVPSKIMKIPSAHQQELQYLNKFSRREAETILQNYYKFMFVREPFHRLLSAFRNKFLYTNNKSFRLKYGEQVMQYESTFSTKVNPNTTALVDGRRYTFRSFFRYLAKTNPVNYNDHWGCYVNRALPCIVQYDFIGKVETMEEDFNFLSLCKLHEGIYKDIYGSKEYTTGDDVFNEFFSTVEDVDAVKVHEIFYKEYHLFGYPMPDIVKLAKSRIRNNK